MIQIALDVATMMMLAGVAAGMVVFYRRMSRLRDAIQDAAQVLPRLNASVAEMGDVAEGFAVRIRGELQAMEGKVAAARRSASDLDISMRNAEDMANKLDGQLRQARRQDQARSRAVPREYAEPKGFAERLEQMEADAAIPAPTPAAESQPPPLALPQPDPQPVRRERLGVASISAFNSFSPPNAPTPRN